MKHTPVIRVEDYKEEKQSDFFPENVTLLGIRYYPSKVGGFGRVACLYIFSDKMEFTEAIYVQVLFDLESEEEKELMLHHPYNVATWDKETFEQFFKPMIAQAKPGKNSYGSNLVFSRPLIPESNNYYKFECVYSDKDTKTDIIRNVLCPKGMWLQLSQFTYWFMCGYPLAPDIFLSKGYNKAKLIPVKNIIFDGSSQVVFMNQHMIMAHFTLYTNSITSDNTVGVNIPIEPLKGKIEKKSIATDTYTKLYGADDTVTPDRFFAVASPEKFYALLSGKGQQFLVYTFDQDLVSRTGWMDWAKFIYL